MSRFLASPRSGAKRHASAMLRIGKGAAVEGTRLVLCLLCGSPRTLGVVAVNLGTTRNSLEGGFSGLLQELGRGGS